MNADTICRFWQVQPGKKTSKLIHMFYEWILRRDAMIYTQNYSIATADFLRHIDQDVFDTIIPESRRVSTDRKAEGDVFLVSNYVDDGCTSFIYQALKEAIA